MDHLNLVRVQIREQCCIIGFKLKGSEMVELKKRILGAMRAPSKFKKHALESSYFFINFP